MRELALDISGLGLILYSQPAVAHTRKGPTTLSRTSGSLPTWPGTSWSAS